MSTERIFSLVYSKIVENDNDLIGHIAYSLYKASKIKYIENFKKEHNDALPTEQDLESFHRVSLTIIPALRIQAEQILSSFIDFTLEESISEIEQKMLGEQEGILKEIIQPIIPTPPKGPWDGFWMAVLVKGVQAIIVAIILFLIVFGSSAKRDFWGAIRSWIPESIPSTTAPSKELQKSKGSIIYDSTKQNKEVSRDSIP